MTIRSPSPPSSSLVERVPIAGRAAALLAPPTTHVDARLVPVALGAWAAALVGVHAGWRWSAALAALAIVVAVIGWRRGAAAVLAAAAATAAVAVVVTAHAHHAATHPARAAAADGAAATVRVRLTDDPRPLRTRGVTSEPGGVDRVAVAAALRSVTIAGETWRAGGRVLLLAPADGWRGLLPGQEVTADGLLATPTGGDLTVAVLRARGTPRDIGAAPWWQDAAAVVRTGLADASRVLPDAPGGLLPSLVVGDTSGLPPAVVEEFRAAGLSHLTAVSGTNVGDTHVACVQCSTVACRPTGRSRSPLMTSWWSAVAG